MLILPGPPPGPTAAKASPIVSDVGESPTKKQRLEADQPSFSQGTIDWFIEVEKSYKEDYCGSGTTPSTHKLNQWNVEPVFSKDHPRLVSAYDISIAAGSKDTYSGQRALIPHLRLPMQVKLNDERKKNKSMQQPLKEPYSTVGKGYIAARPFKKDEPIGFICHEEQIEGETEEQWLSRLVTSEKVMKQTQPRPLWIRVAEFDTSADNSEKPANKVVRVIAHKIKTPRERSRAFVEKYNGMVMQYMEHTAPDEEANCELMTNGCLFAITDINEGETLKCAESALERLNKPKAAA